ncbi:MAG: NFACT family protein [Acetatifactor sp.]|nr:NFACT family protein [Acetatifactor sp.]
MAFDGVTISNIVNELQEKIIGGRIYKIAQPESDELLITVKNGNFTGRITISADASLPLIYLTDINKQSPMTAPGFCMLLRKHLQNGRITDISQPGLERVITFSIEHLDEMGDLCKKKLIVEIMGKHSNIIFCDENDRIIDSIKHVSSQTSSLREVLPGREYFLVKTEDKADILSTSRMELESLLSTKPVPVYKAIYTSYTGISPLLAHELCLEADVDSEISTAGLSANDYDRLYDAVLRLVTNIKEKNFSPCVAYENGKPVEYSAFSLNLYEDTKFIPTMSKLIESFYAEKSIYTRIRQRSTDLRKIVSNLLEKDVKKYDLFLTQLKDTEKKDKFRVWGELLNTYGYSAKPGDKSIDVLNYYTNEEITIPLDPQKSAKENAQKFFDKYGKLKRTEEAVGKLIEEVDAEIIHLKSISNSLDIATNEDDLLQIREEMIQNGYIHKRPVGKKVKINSKPFHFVTSDGYHVYVGKNNLQNDELTFKFATGNDWWFHAKKVPGSHVVLKSNGETDLPDRAFEEAAALAAYYSKGREQDKVEIDYIQKKHVKKPSGAKPGFVVYYTNFSMAVSPDISNLKNGE